jgi:hypothetical protein
METTLVPYSLYLSPEHVQKMRKLAKQRKASAFVRDALIAAFDQTDAYTSGYNKGLRDACKAIDSVREAKMINLGLQRLDEFLIHQIRDLEQNGK